MSLISTFLLLSLRLSIILFDGCFCYKYEIPTNFLFEKAGKLIFYFGSFCFAILVKIFKEELKNPMLKVS